MSDLVELKYNAIRNNDGADVFIVITNKTKEWTFSAEKIIAGQMIPTDYFKFNYLSDCLELLNKNYKVKKTHDFDKKEQDPTGLTPSEPGAKLDAGKIRADLLLDFSRALNAVAEVSDFGAKKYSPGGWQYVPDGVTRYRAAQLRHMLAGREVHDKDSGLLHLAHEAWNALAVLELTIREKESNET